uniref:Uncharacterized protein n=1 Tax=Bos mutus grunniens TaxID=30521 RepID=A0A8B9YQT6_BOSMU
MANSSLGHSLSSPSHVAEHPPKLQACVRVSPTCPHLLWLRRCPLTSSFSRVLLSLPSPVLSHSFRSANHVDCVSHLTLLPLPLSLPLSPSPAPLTCPFTCPPHLPPSPAPHLVPLTCSSHVSSVSSSGGAPVALEAELALTLTVLEAMANSSLGHSLEQPLLTLQNIHSKLQACVSVGAPAQPTASSRPRGRLHHWLHRLQEARKKESQDCLEASVMFNLLRLLTRDLKCVVSGDQCV